jgi:hypothetical protein
LSLASSAARGMPRLPQMVLCQNHGLVSWMRRLTDSTTRGIMSSDWSGLVSPVVESDGYGRTHRMAPPPGVSGSLRGLPISSGPWLSPAPLHPGDNILGERILAEQLGVGLTVVREAILGLSARGLVTAGTGSGAISSKQGPATPECAEATPHTWDCTDHQCQG